MYAPMLADPPIFLYRTRKSIFAVAVAHVHQVMEFAALLFPEWKVMGLPGGMRLKAAPSMLR